MIELGASANAQRTFQRMTSRPLSRRRLIAGFVSTAALTWTGGIAKPYLSHATDRPLITHGLQSGDIGVDSGVVWARSDRPARMQIEIALMILHRDLIVALAARHKLPAVY